MGAAFDIVGRIISTLLGLVLGLTGVVVQVVWSKARKANDPRANLGGMRCANEDETCARLRC